MADPATGSLPRAADNAAPGALSANGTRQRLQHIEHRAQFQWVMAGPPVVKTAHFALHLAAPPAPAGDNASAGASSRPLFVGAGPWVGVVIPKRWAKRAVTHQRQVQARHRQHMRQPRRRHHLAGFIGHCRLVAGDQRPGNAGGWLGQHGVDAGGDAAPYPVDDPLGADWPALPAEVVSRQVIDAIQPTDVLARLDGSVPFNFVSTNDIIGGNSGSPVINAKGEVIGAAFDGNIHSLGGSFGYDPELNRTVTVSTAAVTEALRNVYNQPRLLRELGVRR